MDNKLKPCPFCGGNARVFEHSGSINKRRLYRVGCNNNNCAIKPYSREFYSDLETQICDWNRRVNNEQN